MGNSRIVWDLRNHFPQCPITVKVDKGSSLVLDARDPELEALFIEHLGKLSPADVVVRHASGDVVLRREMALTVPTEMEEPVRVALIRVILLAAKARPWWKFWE